jgi:hypothetical protein
MKQPNRYLDIQSLIESDFYKSNKRIDWDTKHSVYDEMTMDLIKWLSLVKLSKDEINGFNITSPFLLRNLSSYLTHLYDFKVMSKNKIEPSFAENNFYFDFIWKNLALNKIYSIELEKNKLNWSILRYLYAKVIFKLLKSFVGVVVVSKNELLKGYLKKKKINYLQLLPEYLFKINLEPTQKSKKLSEKILVSLVKNIEKKYFKLSKNQFDYLNFIINGLYARTFNDLDNYGSDIKGFKRLLTGTGGNYYSRLFSYFAKSHNIHVSRFDHGGDRVFFQDLQYWNNETFNIDSYFTFGDLAVKNLKAISNKIGKDFSIEKLKNFKFENTYNSKKIISQNNKILYIPSSFVGESRQLPFIKLIDPILFDFEKYLIDVLQNNHFEVIYKQHPKGLALGQEFLGNLADLSLKTSITEALEMVDIVIFEFAGTAIIDALNAEKNIILIDNGIRSFSDLNLQDLKDRVKIISIHWKDNLPYIDEKQLLDALYGFEN